MKRIHIFFALTLLLPVVSVSAQKKHQVTSEAKIQAEKQAKLTEQKASQMIAATQKTIFIDSILVDKDKFLDKYMLSEDAGKLYKYDDFFKVRKQSDAYVYLNELGDKCYYSVEDSIGDFNLYTSDRFDDKWTKPIRLRGINDDDLYLSPNYPFMMADGSTFYFAAKGTESLGGYDIFVTRFDSESGKFLKPENIGMPFNSTANDYMYAIDEFSRIGWFATDRNQPGGKVCIYIFIPSDTRQIYSPDKYSEKQIRSFANIDRIADTWGNGIEKEQAIERLKNVQKTTNNENAQNTIAFVINDKTTYTQESDFRSATNKDKFRKLQALETNRATLGLALDKARDYYASAEAQDRKELKSEIIKSEQQFEKMELQIRQLAKEIRNSENNLSK